MQQSCFIVVLALMLAACGQVPDPLSSPLSEVQATPIPLSSPASEVQATPIPFAPDEVAAAAQQQLDWMREDWDTQQIIDLGFKDEQEVASATVGTPVATYGLDPQAVERYRPGQRVSSLLTPRQVWYVPILAKGEARTTFWMGDNGEGGLVAFEMGGTPEVPGNIVRLQRDLADTTATIKLVEMHYADITFALVEQDGEESIVLLHRMRYPEEPFRSLDAKALEPHPPEEVLPLIRDALPQSHEQGPPEALSPAHDWQGTDSWTAHQMQVQFPCPIVDPPDRSA